MPDLTDDDDDPEYWRCQNKVTQGNNFPCGLSSMEHVHLSVTASKLPQEFVIPEELLQNMHWLF